MMMKWIKAKEILPPKDRSFIAGHYQSAWSVGDKNIRNFILFNGEYSAEGYVLSKTDRSYRVVYSDDDLTHFNFYWFEIPESPLEN
jgi:hypothetical protein